MDRFKGTRALRKFPRETIEAALRDPVAGVREQAVILAGRRLNLSQSAVSHALTRLRELVGGGVPA
mgnify:CR=1 FL=1